MFFGITPRDAAVLDPQVRLFLEESWRAFEDAGLTRDALRGQRVGVFAAAMYGMYELLQTENDGVDVPVSSSLSAIANRVSYFMNFTPFVELFKKTDGCELRTRTKFDDFVTDEKDRKSVV